MLAYGWMVELDSSVSFNLPSPYAIESGWPCDLYFTDVVRLRSILPCPAFHMEQGNEMRACDQLNRHPTIEATSINREKRKEYGILFTFWMTCAYVLSKPCASDTRVVFQVNVVRHFSSFRFHLNLNRFEFFVFLLCSRLDNANIEAQWNVRFTIVWKSTNCDERDRFRRFATPVQPLIRSSSHHTSWQCQFPM